MPPKRQAAAVAAASESPQTTKKAKIKTPEFVCIYKGCDVTSDSKADMTRHVKAVHRKHRCTHPGCTKSFGSTAALGRHVKSVHQGIKERCPDCGKDFHGRGSLRNHIRQVHDLIKYKCPYEDCEKEYTHNDNLQQHIQSVHQGKTWTCTIDDCQKKFGTLSGRFKHIDAVHKGKRWPCPFTDCENEYTNRSCRGRHVKVAHLGRRFCCPYSDCQMVYTQQCRLDHHLKSAHGSPEEEAELRQKKFEIRQFLAEKEARGVCSASRSYENLAAQDSFYCQHHQKSTNIISTVLEEQRELGKLTAASVTTAAEFELLLQRPSISLDSPAKGSLRLLAEGCLDDVHKASTAFIMDTEFIYIGKHLPLDITIARADSGEEILSTRVDYGMSTDDLRDLCLHPVARANVQKVYGKASTTWGMTPKQIVKILQEARVSSDVTI